MPSYMALLLALHKKGLAHLIFKKVLFLVALKTCSLDTALRRILHLTAS